MQNKKTEGTHDSTEADRTTGQGAKESVSHSVDIPENEDIADDGLVDEDQKNVFSAKTLERG
jgi:hypothetical protein